VRVGSFVAWACGVAAAIVACSSFQAAPPDVAPDAESAIDAGGDVRSFDGDVPRGMIFADAAVPFLIDAFEVTTGEFKRFKADPSVPPPATYPGCGTKTTYGPSALCTFVDGDDLPMNCVDWCDALAYCRWAGKRLCGRIGGGPFADGGVDRSDPTKDEWTFACAGGSLSSNRWPYGPTENVIACNSNDRPDAALAPPGSFPLCDGGLAGLFDMTGNAWEWTDGCIGGPGFDEGDCPHRGGSHEDPADRGKCNRVDNLPRDRSYPDLGFRCCKDL
jgi:formylglycine-generating enzyme required for sulfatase activity